KSAYTPSYTSYSSTLTPFTTTTAPSNYASATSSIGGDAKGGAYIPSFLSSAVPEAPSYSSMSTASLDLPMPTMFTPGGADRAATPSSDRAVNPYSSSSLLDNKPDYTSPYRSSQTSTSSTPSYDRKPETTGNTYSYDRKPEMSTFSSYPTSDFSKASGAPSHHSDDGLSSMAVKYTRACEELEHEKEKTRRLEAEVESLRRLQQHSEPGQYRKVAASSGSSDQERAPMSFEGFRQQLEKAFFTRQQQDAIVDRLEEFDREYRIREEEFSLLREQQQTAYEELRVRDQSIRDLQDALTRSKMELQAKDKHLEIIDAQLKEARGTGRFDARSHKGSSANEQSTQQLIADLRDTCKAHQAQNALLGQELSATQESVGAIIRAKSARIADLKQHLDDSRHAFQALRKKYLLSQGLDQDILLELENTRKELFYALAVGIKLNMAESGANTNVDVASMYDEAKNLHYSKWNDWILKRIDEQTLAFRHANRLVTVPSHGGSFRSPGPNRSTSHPGHRAAAAHHSPPKSRQSDRSTSQRDYADTRVGTDARLATYSKPPQKPKSNFFQRMFD
ncbi:MAG: hypothetical protein Q8P67_27835, partial [archaeon]|nr:hypothetical protein [archaeon]